MAKKYPKKQESTDIRKMPSNIISLIHSNVCHCAIQNILFFFKFYTVQLYHQVYVNVRVKIFVVRNDKTIIHIQ